MLMVTEIFSADSNTREVKVLGIVSSSKLENIQILINGQNILENLQVKDVRIISKSDKDALDNRSTTKTPVDKT